MLRSVLRLRPKKGREHDVVRLFADRSILDRATAMPGCLGVDLGLDEDAGDILVTAVWASLAAYDGWLESGGRAEELVLLLPLLLDGPEGISPTRTYQILLSAAVIPGNEHAI